MESLGFALRGEAILRTLTEDVVKSSEIEGAVLDREQVRSSVARRLGMDVGGLLPADRDVEGVVELMLDATQNYRLPLTDERSEEHTSELQSLMRISYAVFCLKKKKTIISTQ